MPFQVFCRYPAGACFHFVTLLRNTLTAGAMLRSLVDRPSVLGVVPSIFVLKVAGTIRSQGAEEKFRGSPILSAFFCGKDGHSLFDTGFESSRFSGNHPVSSLNNVYLTVLVKLVGAAGLGGGGGGGVVLEE